MASARLLKSACRMCQVSLTRFHKPVKHDLSIPQKRLLSMPFPPSATELPQEELAEYEVSTEEFKFVERILPPQLVPAPPQHESYPTPSGWIPPKEITGPLPYSVKRTRNHMLPIYQEFTNGNTRKLVLIKNIYGDIWAFDAALREYLLKVTTKPIIATQVHEIGGYVRVKGLVADEVCQFLLDKGF